MERYRSGHNGADSKSVCAQAHEGSNPSLSAIKETSPVYQAERGFCFGSFEQFISSCYNLTKGIISDMQKNRLTHIDLIKTIAIFFVLMYHCTLFSIDFLSDSSPIYYMHYFYRTILATCVPLFFFVNGYLLFGSKFDLRKHIFKIVKMTILTMVWAVITMCVLQVLRGEYFSIVEFLRAIWNWKEGWVNHLWFMGALICIYVIFPILKNAYDTNIRLFTYFAISCALFTIGNTFINHMGTVGANLLLGKKIVFDGFEFFNMFNPFRGIYGYTLVYFCVGGLAYRFQGELTKISIKKRNVISVLGIVVSCSALFAIGCLYSKLNGSIWDVVWNGYDTIFTLINVLCIFVLSLNWQKDSRIVRTISSNTLGIYFIHINILYPLIPYMENCVFLSNPIVNILINVLVLGVCVCICIVLRKCPFISKLVK